MRGHGLDDGPGRRPRQVGAHGLFPGVVAHLGHHRLVVSKFLADVYGKSHLVLVGDLLAKGVVEALDKLPQIGAFPVPAFKEVATMALA